MFARYDMFNVRLACARVNVTNRRYVLETQWPPSSAAADRAPAQHSAGGGRYLGPSLARILPPSGGGNAAVQATQLLALLDVPGLPEVWEDV